MSLEAWTGLRQISEVQFITAQTDNRRCSSGHLRTRFRAPPHRALLDNESQVKHRRKIYDWRRETAS